MSTVYDACAVQLAQYDLSKQEWSKRAVHSQNHRSCSGTPYWMSLCQRPQRSQLDTCTDTTEALGVTLVNTQKKYGSMYQNKIFVSSLWPIKVKDDVSTTRTDNQAISLYRSFLLNVYCSRELSIIQGTDMNGIRSFTHYRAASQLGSIWAVNTIKPVFETPCQIKG